MADKTINTRLILRNDTLENWRESKRILYAGEAALARLSGELSGKYEVRIGVGDKTWSQLSASNFIIPVESVDGLEDKIRSLSTSYYETDDIGKLSAKTYVNGDIAVEKKVIALSTETSDGEQKESYTAYRYSTGISAWQALDGNYNADNVYFDYDITKAGTWTGVGNVSHTAKTVETMSSRGKSVAEVMDMIFKGEEGMPALAADNKPTCGVSTPAKSGYVGEYVTPTASFSYNAKTYTYGSNTNSSYGSTTGATLGKYWYKYNSAGVPTTTDVKDSGTTASVTLTDADKYQIADEGTVTRSFNIYLSADYSAAPDGKYIPKTSLDRSLSAEPEYSKYRTADGQATSSSTGGTSVTGYFPFYAARFNTNQFSTYVDAEKNTKMSILSSDIVNFDGGAVTAKTYAGQVGFTKGQTKPSSAGYTAMTMQQWIWVVKAGKVSKIEVTQQSPEAPVTVNKQQIQLPLDNGYKFGGSDSVTYDLFFVAMPSSATNSFKVTVS